MLFDNVEFVSNKREQHAHTHTYIACECDCHLCVLCPTEIKSSNKIIWRFWPHSNKSTVFRSICVFFYIFHLFFFHIWIHYFFIFSCRWRKRRMKKNGNENERFVNFMSQQQQSSPVKNNWNGAIYDSCTVRLANERKHAKMNGRQRLVNRYGHKLSIYKHNLCKFVRLLLSRRHSPLCVNTLSLEERERKKYRI